MASNTEHHFVGGPVDGSIFGAEAVERSKRVLDGRVVVQVRNSERRYHRPAAHIYRPVAAGRWEYDGMIDPEPPR